MGRLNKWLLILGGLGAGYLVVANPDAFLKFAKGAQGLTSGAVAQVTTGGKSGQIQ